MKSRRWTKMSTPGRSNDLPRFTRGRVDLYGGRLLPVCCPDAGSLIFGIAIRVAPRPACFKTWR